MRLLTCVLLAGLAITALPGCSASHIETFGTGGSGGSGAGGAGGAPNTSSISAGGSGGGFVSSSSVSASSSGGSTTSSASASSSSSSGSAHGDCTSDADCPGAGHCVEVLPGGFHVCKEEPYEASQCNNPNIDQCCDAMPCPNGQPCYLGPLVPYCGGPQLNPYNQCAMDQCAQDSECPPEQFCGQAGTLGRLVRACIPAGCKVDADCSAQPNGVCAPVEDACCQNVAGLYCVYPNGGCRNNGDCPAGSYCTVSGDETTCVQGAPICPA